MSDERLGQDAGRWLRDIDTPPPNPHVSVQQAMAEVRRTRQVRRWWPPSFPGKADARDSDIPTGSYEPTSIPASNGPSPTVTGRTRSMFSPAKAITVGAIIFAIRGDVLIVQPFGQGGGGVPGAATDGEREAPVEFTARTTWDQQVSDGVEALTEDGVHTLEGGAWQFRFIQTSTPASMAR